MQLNKTNKKQKNLISIGVLSLLTSVLFYAAFIPYEKEINLLHADINNKRVEIQKNNTTQRELGGIMSKLNQIELQSDKINKAFLNSNKQLEFITSIERLSEQYNINQTINLGIVADDKTSNITITAGGSFVDIFKFLNSLESLPYYININNLSLNGTGSNLGKQENGTINELKKINLKLEATNYWQ